MSDVILTKASRVIRASELRVAKQTGGAQINFATDHVILLNDDGYPIAECIPLGAAPAQTYAPRLASLNGEPRPERERPRTGPVDMVGGGRLTDAHRELMIRLWMDHPRATVDQIGELFEEKAGRTISALTVSNYKPKAGKPVV